MTLLRNAFKVSDSLLFQKKCVALKPNFWNAELYFGSKIEVPSPPKRPLTAYMIFCKENRKTLLKENPSLSSPEQIKVLAEKWSHLTRDMKKPYEISARESTLLYGELHKKFYENLTEEQKEELTRLKIEKRESRRTLKLKKALRDSNVPKPPLSAYAHFVQTEAKVKPIVTHPSEFIKKVAEVWKNLPETSKKEFESQAQADKKRYVAELNAWRTKMLAEGKSDLIKVFEEIKGKGKLLESQTSTVSKKKAADKKTAADKTPAKPKVEASKN